MHELSIAMSIVDIALEEAKMLNATEVIDIDIEVGHWAGVDCDALLFSLDAAKQYSPLLKKSKINLIRKEPLMYCEGCNKEFRPDVQYVTNCALCNSEKIKLIQGRELSVLSLNIKD
ncbi:MAG: hydrogenase maturation nickel metallochaperone HypA [Bacteroidales bacterium]